MSFGDGIASVCARVEERHGAAWGWVAAGGIVGGVICAGLLLGWLVCEHGEWSVGREWPDQLPCSEPHVCDTFHGFLAHDLRKTWNDDIKKW